MWPRVVEFMLACYLAACPFIFRHSTDAVASWTSDFACALLIGTLALLSFWHRTAWAHWLIILVGIWMVAFGRFGDRHPLPPGLQNNIALGITLILFAIIPNQADRPPRIWFSKPARCWDQRFDG